MQITMTRPDVTIGVSTNPSVTIELPKISFETYDQDRPMDDILGEGIGFASHYSLSDALGIRVTVRNTQANYTS
jgi:hypothetical protein